ncbi:MAG: hypothetical protein CVU97_01825 [Firmicutes bacterium HGW-Firmicutes-21]|nr:MAG: hypothetical protein CVU97_01825 [Firmicutes bacterium HGW-Firmicutes-21]
MSDREIFSAAIEYCTSEDRCRNGIGTYKEKTLHAVLKRYIESNEKKQEISVGSFVADIVNEKGITEIQTRSFEQLRKKLEHFLQTETVTVVFPMARTKWLLWVDKSTGGTTKKRRSPKTGRPYQAFFELYKIKQLLTHPNLKLRLIMLDIEEYRFLDGWSRDKKKGSSRCERIPTELVEEIHINCPADYKKLIPDTLPDAFTSADYAKETGLNRSSATTALNVLFSVGVIARKGRNKKGYVYENK